MDPEARSTLRDLLGPPPGYHLDRALGTAYSLDAETLVTIPLFASGLNAEELEKPLGIVRAHELGQCIDLLVQGDRLSIGRRWASSRALLRLMGETVVPCSVEGGSFHPKLLVLEFAADEPSGRRHHRVVISTRNLTTDNSWDSTVVLEEAHGGVHVAGLGEAVSGLGAFVNDKDHDVVDRCRRLGSTLQSIRFEPVNGLEDLEIALFGPGSANAERLLGTLVGDDLLVISPFVTDGFLKKIAARGGADQSHRWLVTRPTGIPEATFSDYQVFQIAPGATPEHHAADAREGEPADPLMAEPAPAESLVGLHAKIYVASAAKGATRFVVTSANATSSGWSNNVEIAIAGRSRRRTFKVPELLRGRASHDDDRTFGDLLDPIPRSAVVEAKDEPPWEKLARAGVAGAIAVGRVVAGPPRTLQFTIRLALGSRDFADELASARASPFGQSHLEATLEVTKDALAGDIEIAVGLELVPFLTLVLTSQAGETVALVLAVRLEGDVDWGRDEARHALLSAARPALIDDLLWYLGGSGGRAPSKDKRYPGGHSPESDKAALPVLERILLRVNGSGAAKEIATIDGLLAGVADHPGEYGDLINLWHLVKGSL